MTDQDNHAARLRDRAARLLAVALKAREDGYDDHAEELTRLASEAMDQAADIEGHATEVADLIPRIPQQTQQPQSAHRRKKPGKQQRRRC